MTRALRSSALALLVAVVATGGTWPPPGGVVWSARQDAAPPVEVGAGPIREPALGVVGRNEYRPESVLLYGYLAAVIGLDPARLFTDPNAASEATARFTYAAEVAIADRAEQGELTVVAGSGTLTIYLDDAGAVWDDPASFAAGIPVATMTIDLRDTLRLQSPTLGVVVGDDELIQVAATPFALGGERYRFGHVGARQRLRYVGALVGAEGSAPALVVSLTGSAVVTERDPNPPVDAEPDATAPAGGCPGVEAWLGDAARRLEQVGAIGADIPLADGVAALDAEAIAEAAAEVAALATAQRQAAVPAIGLEANRLAVTALSTYARGLSLLAAAGDEASLAQARTILADGEELTARALSRLGEIAADCGIGS